MRASPLLLLGSFSVLFGLGAIACGDSGSTSGGGASGTGGTSTSGPGTGGASTTTTTDTTTSTSSGPLMCPSAVTNIPTGECDLFLQDCPNSNQLCAFVDAGTGGGGGGSGTTTACVTANGLKTIGQGCANQGECAAGLFCIGDPGTCTPACCKDNDEPCMGGSCNLTVNVGGTPPNELTFWACSFSESCMPFMPDSCVVGEDCHLSGPGFFVCDQPSPTPKAEGEACVYVNDCGDSQVCAGTDPDYFCRYLCKAGSSAAVGLGGCPSGQACDLSFDTGDNTIGLCHP